MVSGITCSDIRKDTFQNKLLLISFDGFRPDYLDLTETPNFDRLTATGIKGEGLIPVFPTKTFPNHYSIVTGLYPENTGLIGNSMYEPASGMRYSIGDREQVENPHWYKGEPIWNTAEKAGIKAGTMFWVGSEAPIQNMRPTHWKTYDGSMDRIARIDSVVKWMSYGDEKEVDLATLYYSVVDSRGHRHGPESEEVIEAIQLADSLMGYLISSLEEKGLFDRTDIIIVSDHGMTEVSRERLVILDDLIDVNDIQIVEGSPSLMFNVTDGKEESIYEALRSAEKHYSVYRRGNLPDGYHLNHPRMPDILMVAERGYTINTREYVDSRPGYPSGGAHGYDHNDPEMHALFVAHGPSFREGFEAPPFENIHLYDLMTHILRITSPQTDGSYKEISFLLRY